jgi:hypothetical protein
LPPDSEEFAIEHCDIGDLGFKASSGYLRRADFYPEAQMQAITYRLTEVDLIDARRHT